MFLDAQLRFSDAQAITADAESTNTIDMSAVRDIGTGRPLHIVTVVDVAMTDGSSDSTLAVILHADSTTTITPDATLTLYTIPAVTGTGNMYISTLSPGHAVMQYRYFALRYTPANGNLTTGSFTSFIALDIQQATLYADNITIS